MGMERVFEFNNEEDFKEYMYEQTHKILDIWKCYGNRNNRNGLVYNVDSWFNAKLNLYETIFKDNPYHNGKGQLVMPKEIEIPADAEIVSEFSSYLRNRAGELLEQVTIDGLTYQQTLNEKSKYERIIYGLRYTELPLDSFVNVDGKTFYEYDEKLEELTRIVDEFQSREGFRYIHPNKYISKEEYEKYDKIIRLSYLINQNVGEFVTEFISPALLELFPNCQGRPGAKMSKVINKCLTQIGFVERAKATEEGKREYNQMWTKYGDAIKPRTEKRWTILSINFIDYLTMSNGTGWTSCLNPDHKGVMVKNGLYKDGFNCKRTLDYAMDETTMVLYTVKADYDGDEPEFEQKCIRQLFHFGYDKLIQSRIYPQEDRTEDEYYKANRETVEYLIATGLKQANLWSSPTYGLIDPEDENVFIPGYEDWENGDYIDFSTDANHGYDEDHEFKSQVNYVYFRGSDERPNNNTPMVVGENCAVGWLDGEEFYDDEHRDMNNGRY